MNQILLQEKRNALLRLWHWLSFILVFSLIITAGINEWIIEKSFSEELISIMKEKGLDLEQQQARRINSVYRHIVWDWHKASGIALTIIFVFRIIAEWQSSQESRLGYRLAYALRIYKQNQDPATARWYLGIQFTYLIFYVAILIMMATGLLLYFEDDISESIKEVAEEIHATVMYLIVAFVLIHLGGVIRAEFGKYKGIVSKMINGN